MTDLTPSEQIVRDALGETDAKTYNGTPHDLDDLARRTAAKLHDHPLATTPGDDRGRELDALHDLVGRAQSEVGHLDGSRWGVATLAEVRTRLRALAAEAEGEAGDARVVESSADLERLPVGSVLENEQGKTWSLRPVRGGHPDAVEWRPSVVVEDLPLRVVRVGSARLAATPPAPEGEAGLDDWHRRLALLVEWSELRAPHRAAPEVMLARLLAPAPAGPQAEGAGETGDVRFEAVMADPGVADWGGEMTEQGTPIYHHPWDSDDGELRLWVGPHDGQLDSGWTVSLSARGLDVDLHTDPERILRWLDGVRQAITLSREEAHEGAGETAGGEPAQFVRLCVDTRHPIDPGNYRGPVHCTAHPQGHACVTAVYDRRPETTAEWSAPSGAGDEAASGGGS